MFHPGAGLAEGWANAGAPDRKTLKILREQRIAGRLLVGDLGRPAHLHVVDITHAAGLALRDEVDLVEHLPASQVDQRG